LALEVEHEMGNTSGMFGKPPIKWMIISQPQNVKCLQQNCLRCLAYRKLVRRLFSTCQQGDQGPMLGFFKNIFAENFGKKMSFLTENKANYKKI
jgi:hypothetical protein